MPLSTRRTQGCEVVVVSMAQFTALAGRALWKNVVRLAVAPLATPLQQRREGYLQDMFSMPLALSIATVRTMSAYWRVPIRAVSTSPNNTRSKVLPFPRLAQAYMAI